MNNGQICPKGIIKMRGNILAETNSRKHLVRDIKSANVKSYCNWTGYWHINSLIGSINGKALCEFLNVFKTFLYMQLLCT